VRRLAETEVVLALEMSVERPGHWSIHGRIRGEASDLATNRLASTGTNG
jgi:hypothetical protein